MMHGSINIRYIKLCFDNINKPKKSGNKIGKEQETKKQSITKQNQLGKNTKHETHLLLLEINWLGGNRW